MQEEGVVLLERTERVATITLSHPGVLNALTWKMYQQLEEHIETLAQDEALRVVIIRGAGKAFAAGTDISQFQNFDGSAGVQYEQRIETVIENSITFPAPPLPLFMAMQLEQALSSRPCVICAMQRPLRALVALWPVHSATL